MFRQLESELTALTEENNARLAELSQQIDDLRVEKQQLHNLLQSGLDSFDDKNIETLRQNERYLRYELEKSLVQYSQLQVRFENDVLFINDPWNSTISQNF